MIADLKPYREYKESGHEWLGCIPTGWEVRKLKYLTRFVNGLPFKPRDWGASGTPIIRIQNLNGSREFNYTNRRDLPQELLIRQGDLLFAWSGNRGTSFGPSLWKEDFTGYLNQHIFKLVGYSLETRYFYYLLRAATSHIEEEKTHGIIGLVHVTKPELGSTSVPVAPEQEWTSIVRYLDWGCKRLDRAIRAKRKIIASLNEQKRAVISHTVTRGIDSRVQLKHSGVDWIGEIPAHWSVLRIKNVMRTLDHRSSTGTEELLSVRMHHGIVRFSEHFQRPPQARTLVNFKIVQPGQFVVNRMQAGNGLIYCSDLFGLVSPDYSVLEAIADVNKEFLGELMRSRLMRWKFRVESKGLGTGTSGFLRLYDDRLGAVHVALPPRQEQDSIMLELKEKLSGLIEATCRVEREMDLLLEYRTRLIADVVTGKLDVREAAASLPDAVPEQSEPEIDAQEFEDEDLAAAGRTEE